MTAPWIRLDCRELWPYLTSSCLRINFKIQWPSSSSKFGQECLWYVTELLIKSICEIHCSNCSLQSRPSWLSVSPPSMDSHTNHKRCLFASPQVSSPIDPFQSQMLLCSRRLRCYFNSLEWCTTSETVLCLASQFHTESCFVISVMTRPLIPQNMIGIAACTHLSKAENPQFRPPSRCNHLTKLLQVRWNHSRGKIGSDTICYEPRV